jgi:hypothetical protein
MSADADRKQRLEALTRAAADSLGPIASLLVDQAAADGAPLDEVRKRVAVQVEEGGRAAFLQATKSLAAAAGAPAAAGRAAATPAANPVSQPPAAAPAAPPAAPAGAPQPGPGTLDRSDPQLVQALVNELAKQMGAAGESLVREAARRCRTKTQLYVRLAGAVADPELKALLMHRAATDISTRAG